MLRSLSGFFSWSILGAIANTFDFIVGNFQQAFNPQPSDTHRIMKNTVMLYIRMGFIMLVNLFLIRLVMEQRFFFFFFALGRRDPDLLAKTYSTNLLICRVQLNLEKVR